MSIPSLQATPLALALMLAFTMPAASAQTAPADSVVLNTVKVSASALSLASNDMSTPVTVLEGDELIRLRGATLGETLDGQPGITSSHFGAGASRPIIRGMDGPRVKILSDGAEVQDASTISPDHAVAAEPMLAEQIEVLRGPSALAYGGGAVGGVVNLLDRKIPTRVPAKGIEGSAELRANSAAREKAGAFEMTGGSGNVAIHAEGVKRDAGAYRVGSGWSKGSTVDGSYNKTDTGSVGLSWIGEQGYLGLAYTRQHAEYGLPGHNHEFEGCHPHGAQLHCGGHDHGHDDGDDQHGHDAEQEGGHEHGHESAPYVKLNSERWDVRGEYRNPLPGFAKLRVRAAFTDYRHQEIEGETVATTFKNKAHDGRVELEHDPIGGWRGVLGLQTSQRDFSALGEEAYVAPTITKKHAVFLIEEYKLRDWRLEAGLRHESQTIAVDSPSLNDSSERGTSLSFGAVWKFAPQYSLGSSLSRSHRLPSAEELYANGVHMATSTYEIGNPNLSKETSHNLDLTLRKYAGATTFSLSGFHNRINHYIYANTLDDHQGFQLIEYTQRDATFTGLEGQVRRQLDAVFGASLFGDVVRARLDDGGGNLPRIPAQRLGVKLDANWQSWNGLAEWYRVGRQDQVAPFETETAGYNMLNVSATYNTRLGNIPTQFYIKGNNLTNALAFSHTSFIKNAAPLMGRNISAGMRVTF